MGTGRGRGHAVLSGARLGYDALFAQPPGQQRLSQGVVDLVRTGVGQVLSLEIDLRPAQMGGQPPGVGERCWAAHVSAHQVVQLRLELGADEEALGCTGSRKLTREAIRLNNRTGPETTPHK